MKITLQDFLARHEIQYTLYKHPAVFTVAEAQVHCSHIPGIACKNLFVLDSKMQKYYLITTPALKSIRINEIRKMIGAKKLHFASPEELATKLALLPGSVTPLGLVNNQEHDVEFLIDQEIWDADLSSFHPNTNTETITIDRENFHRLVSVLGNFFRILTIPSYQK